MISENSIVKKSENLFMSVIDNEAVILGIDNGMYVGLNEMGTEIWSILNETIRVSDIIDTLSSQYDEDEVVIRDQVMEFLEDLLEKSLIVIEDAKD